MGMTSDPTGNPWVTVPELAPTRDGESSRPEGPQATARGRTRRAASRRWAFTRPHYAKNAPHRLWASPGAMGSFLLDDVVTGCLMRRCVPRVFTRIGVSLGDGIGPIAFRPPRHRPARPGCTRRARSTGHSGARGKSKRLEHRARRVPVVLLLAPRGRRPASTLSAPSERTHHSSCAAPQLAHVQVCTRIAFLPQAWQRPVTRSGGNHIRQWGHGKCPAARPLTASRWEAASCAEPDRYTAVAPLRYDNAFVCPRFPRLRPATCALP